MVRRRRKKLNARQFAEWFKSELTICENGCVIKRHSMDTPNDEGVWNVKFNGIDIRVHRVSWYVHYGTFPSSRIRHTCNNIRCCNVEHMRLEGTKRTNHLDSDIIATIKAEYQQGFPAPQLARDYGVSEQAIYKLVDARKPQKRP